MHGCPCGDFLRSSFTPWPSKCLPTPQRDTPIPDKQAPCLRWPLPLPNSWPEEWKMLKKRGSSGCLWACLSSHPKEKKKNQPPTFLIPSHPLPWYPESVPPMIWRPSLLFIHEDLGPAQCNPLTDFSLLPMRYHC